MFNGIVYHTGKIKYIAKKKKSISLGIKTNLRFNKIEIGSSISCNGVCLTLESIKNKLIFFYISKETLLRSNLKYLKINDIINIEKSIIYGQKISGHFIQGHVDTTALVQTIKIIEKSWIVKFKIKDKKLAKFLLEKASVTINGDSLTISRVKNNFFEINIIPHTLKLTNLKNLKKMSVVNLELDIFCKYIINISN